MKTKSIMISIVLLIFASAGQLYSQTHLYRGYQQASDNNTQKYPMFALGYGNSYGGLGGQVAYKINRLALHAGLGYFDPSLIEELDWMGEVALFNVGAKYYITSMENIFLDLSFGTYGVEGYRYWDSHGYYDSDWTYIAGPLFSGGIDYFFLKNLGVNLGLGMGVNLNHQPYAPDVGIIIVGVDLGIVFRLLP